MTCPCDLKLLPRGREIPSGLAMLPHPVNNFGSLRGAMLSSLPDFSALDDWNARAEDDLGVMLLEFMAYAGHVVEFYNWAFANDTYLRTAQREAALAGIVAAIGYAPRPGAPATVELAAIAGGTAPVSLPGGQQFRSAAFEDEAPQVFEAEVAKTLYPQANRWSIAAPRRPTLGEPGTTVTDDWLDLQPMGLEVEAEDLILLASGADPLGTYRVTALEDVAQADATPVTRAWLDRPLDLPGETVVADLKVMKAGQVASLFTMPADDPDAGVSLILYLPPLPAFETFDLDRVRADLRTGMPVVVSHGEDHRWFTAAGVRAIQKVVVPGQTIETEIIVDDEPVISSAEIPPARSPVTRLTLDADFNDPARRWPGFGAYIPQTDLESFEVRYGFGVAARIAPAPVMEIWPDAPLTLQPEANRRVPMPPEPEKLRRYLIADGFGGAKAVDGSLDPDAGRFEFAEGTDWDAPLVPPVTLFGNVVPARRGETIAAEIIGTGDASQAGQIFALSKAPVAFLPDTTGATERGYRSTVTLRAGGVKLDEVEQIATAGPDDDVFMLRQTPEGDTVVETGDGVFGRRLSSGAEIRADYVHGAGAAAPPAGGIEQIAKPLEGLSAILNPVAASGGADPETPEDVRRNAPGVALLLGRVVSRTDALAVAQAFPGVTAARADLVWHDSLQTAAMQVWIIGTDAVAEDLEAKLRNLSEPGYGVSVRTAEALPLRLAFEISVDDKYEPHLVEDAVRARLMDPFTGLLPPERIGIGAVLFRSHLFAEVLAVPGTVAVPSLTHDDMPFMETGLRPGPDRYFDVVAGGLILNGRESSDDE